MPRSDVFKNEILAATQCRNEALEERDPDAEHGTISSGHGDEKSRIS